MPQRKVKRMRVRMRNLHLVVEDLRLASLGLGDQGLIQDVEDVLADLLELGLDLLTVITDDTNVLVGTLRLLLLLDGGDNAPRGTAGTDNILVSNGEQVTLVDSELATDLGRKGKSGMRCGEETMWCSYVGDFLFNC
jgi:hypothetical protein